MRKLPAVPACLYDRRGRLIDEPRKLPKALRYGDRIATICAASEWRSLALWCELMHSRVAQSALLLYGNHGALVSGSVRSHFPSGVKDTLRSLAHHATAFHTIARVYYRIARRHPNITATMHVFNCDASVILPMDDPDFYERMMRLVVGQRDTIIRVTRIA